MRYPGRAVIAGAALMLGAQVAAAEDSGVIFMYHHVARDTPAATSVRPDEFVEQLEWLDREGFAVLPLLEMLESLQAGSGVPDKAVAITFDDAYSSVLSTAMPELRKRGWPFTVFVSTEAVDQGFRGYLSWDELRELGRSGASFGNHSASHAHLVRQADGESRAAWVQRVSADIRDARRRLSSELGDLLVVPVFAYPYGEYTVEVRQLLGGQERYGLGQHSGAVGHGSDFLALPRYPVATGLELADFGLRARSRALPVNLVEPERHIVGEDEDQPALRLTLNSDDDIRITDLACYASGQGRMTVEWVDQRRREFIARPAEALRPGRSKYNCTAPSNTRAGTWYWFGYLWMRQLPDGSWYTE